jgi:serine/threonine protein kinase
MSAVRATTFGRYLLLEEMARGGMAAVYRAVLRDSSGFEKHVALKRVLRELGDDPEFVTRFTDEARIVSTLTHANIAQVFDFGQVDEEYFLAMELVDGPDLGTLLEACKRQGQPVPIPTAVHVVAEMCRGLGFAHNRRNDAGEPAPVVHRDVSPQNVLVARSGEVKVVDFGIAKAAEKALRTRTGMVMGKCRHMAPEQALGSHVDARADVFACGTVLFEALTGAPLFQGSTVQQVLGAVINAPIPLASSINPEVPPELDEILSRALARAAGSRYPDGSAMARELEALLHRMAPDHSRDDLASFVRALVPPPEHAPGKWQAAATVHQDSAADSAMANGALQPRPTAAGLGPTLVEDLDGAAPPTAEAGGGDSSARALEPSAAHPFALSGGSVTAPPLEADEAGSAGADTPHTDLVDEAPAGARRRWLVLAAAGGIAAVLLGLGGRALLAGSGPPATHLRVGQPLRHHGWALTVQQIERARDRLLLHVAVVPPRGASVDDARLALGDGQRLRPPLVTSRDPEARGALVVVFPRPGAAPRLRFMAPDAPPLVLDLVRR